MSASLEKVADMLHMKKEELTAEGLRAYLKGKLRELMAEINSIYLKYGVSSLEELDEKINRGERGETETFGDFTKLDNLEAEAEKIKGVLESLE
ncbi:MAG: hypothetical protein V3R93_04455 [Candidatus Hydrothermarchaeaceae archaeon]